MAYKALVENPTPFVKQVIAFIQQMTEQNQGFALALLVPYEASPSDRWNLVLSAPWIDDGGLEATIPSITSALLRFLSRANAKKLARVSIVPILDPLVDRLSGLHVSPGEAYHLLQYVGLTSDDAGPPIILVAEQPRAVQNYNAQSLRTRA
jgi:hypothetical protein